MVLREVLGAGSVTCVHRWHLLQWRWRGEGVGYKDIFENRKAVGSYKLWLQSGATVARYCRCGLSSIHTINIKYAPFLFAPRVIYFILFFRFVLCCVEFCCLVASWRVCSGLACFCLFVVILCGFTCWRRACAAAEASSRCGLSLPVCVRRGWERGAPCECGSTG